MAKRRRNPSPVPGLPGSRWWLADETRLAGAVVARATEMWNADAGRRADAERTLLRWGLDIHGLYPAYRSTTPSRLDAAAAAVRINLTKSLTETITAKIGKQRPRPLVLTTRGDYGLKMRAKKLQRFLDAQYRALGVYDVAPLVFRNAMLLGDGVIGVCADRARGRITLENVFPLELLVDPVEAARGNPRNLFRVYPEDKDTLQERYPEHAAAIEDSGAWGPNGEDAPAPDGTSGYDHRVAVVYEAWRLAGVGPDGTEIPGRHVKVVGSAVLEDEEWCDPFPFLVQPWGAPIRGFWGDSAVSEIRGLEQEVNVLLQRAQDAMRRSGMPYVLSHEDDELKTAKLSNEPGVVIKYSGQVKPEITVGQPLHPQILEQAWQLRRVAAEQLGTNELQTSATRPVGVESGRALEQLSEEHAVRFETISRSFETTLSVGLARQLVSAARRLDEALPGGYRLRAAGRDREVIDIAWKEAALGPEELFLEVWPVSVLPHTPSGRTAEVERWQGNQWITPARARELLEFPDIDEERSMVNASADLLDWQLSEMLDEGRNVVPDKRQDLQEALSRGTMAKLRARREGVPYENIELLEDFLAAVEELLAPPPPIPDPSMMSAPVDPMAALGATPAVGGLPPMDPGMDPAMGATPAVGGLPPGMDLNALL